MSWLPYLAALCAIGAVASFVSLYFLCRWCNAMERRLQDLDFSLFNTESQLRALRTSPKEPTDGRDVA